ncbi:hypothetical protein [Mesorhizobium sp. KR1-2]|uniref:hypothetical protein n=1 Tax=Mesorhizobium sp. KR1-2 TaxID=3156609 RepID=UPI0032B42EF6
MSLHRCLPRLALGIQLAALAGPALADGNSRSVPTPTETSNADPAQPTPPNPAPAEPLRKLLQPDQPFCYGVDYDQAFLDQNADQQTVSIRVSRGPAEIAAYRTRKSKSWPNGANIAVAVKTREGTDAVQQSYTCSPEGEQWRCVSNASADAACEMLTREVFLNQGAENTIMLGNPSDGLPSVELCSKLDASETADKSFQLKPMSLSECGL